MEAVPPVLMPAWVALVAALGAAVLAIWLLRTFLVTRRDLSLEVGDIPMAADERQRWGDQLTTITSRWEAGDLDLRGLHLELASLVRGFAQARSGQEVTTATVTEILDMADTSGPRPVMDRLRRARREGRPVDTNPLGYVGELLAVWEQPSFDREPEAAAQEAIDRAGWVVSQW
ncbi:alpha-amylase [Actinomyces wuliandei]|uniref:alpha-amylase n=1 Tax=Actinomyces wuliandei TaxID=2057743 RepID=UPI00111B9DE0|nr:alpha-amylase [Actinomyces wuliandei]